MPRFDNRKLAVIYIEQRGRCRECGRYHRAGDYSVTWNVDHVVPQSYGGSDETWNLALTCIECNSARGNELDIRDLEEALRRGRRSRNENLRQVYRKGRGNGPRQAHSRIKCHSCGVAWAREGLNYCNSCDEKDRAKRLAKKVWECNYGRCHRPKAVSYFLGLFAIHHDYCAQHQAQWERGGF